jgi:hypothetical protein
MLKKILLAAAFVLAFAPGLLTAGPNPGDPAPDFGIPDTTNTIRHLSEFQGKVVQLFFWSSS